MGSELNNRIKLLYSVRTEHENRLIYYILGVDVIWIGWITTQIPEIPIACHSALAILAIISLGIFFCLALFIYNASALQCMGIYRHI